MKQKYQKYNYDQNDDNTLRIRILDKNGKIVEDEFKVLIEFSKNGLIGFGSQIIDLAETFEDGKHIHMDAAQENNIVQRLGVYLTSDSKETIIMYTDLGVIDESIRTNKK